MNCKKENMMKTFVKKFTKNFAAMLLVATVLGILAGVIFGESINIIAPLGTIFTRLLSMLVPLLVFFSISSSFSNIGDARKLSKYAGKTIGFFLMTTLMATILGIVFGLIFKPGLGMTIPDASFEVTEITAAMFIDWLPSNILGCIAEGNTIQIVFLSIFIGTAVIFIEDGKAKESIQNFLNSGQTLCLTLVKGIMYYAPIGIFALMATSLSNFKGSLLGEMGSFLTAYSLAFIIQISFCYLFLFWFFTRLNPFRFTKKILPAILTAFSTTSSSATMAVTLQNVKDCGVDDEIADFGIPLGVTFNMDSMGIEIPLFIMLGMFAMNTTPTISQLFLFAIMGIAFSIGCAGIPGGGLAIAVIIVNAFNLPVEVVAWIAAVFFFLDVTGTAMNVWGDAVCTTIVAKSENMLDVDTFYA